MISEYDLGLLQMRFKELQEEVRTLRLLLERVTATVNKLERVCREHSLLSPE